jgi:hypothetical protein
MIFRPTPICLPCIDYFDRQVLGQQTLVDRFRFLSPAVVTQAALNDITGTSEARYRHFLSLVNDFHQRWRAYFNPRIVQKVSLRAANDDAFSAFALREEGTGAARVGWVARLARASAGRRLARLARAATLFSRRLSRRASRTGLAQTQVHPMRCRDQHGPDHDDRRLPLRFLLQPQPDRQHQTCAERKEQQWPQLPVSKLHLPPSFLHSLKTTDHLATHGSKLTALLHRLRKSKNEDKRKASHEIRVLSGFAIADDPIRLGAKRTGGRSVPRRDQI